MNTPKSWQSLFGEFRPNKSSLTFVGGESPPPKTSPTVAPAEPMPAHGVAMCDLVFDRGDLEFTVAASDAPSKITAQAVLSYDAKSDSLLVAGLTDDKSPWGFSIGYYNGPKGWDTLAFGGVPNRMPRHPYHVKVVKRGSNVVLGIDGVIVLSHDLKFPVPTTQCGIFIRSPIDVTIQGFRADSKLLKAFVVMQFSDPYAGLFDDVLRPVADEMKIDIEKADDVFGPGVVISDIARQIREADIVIADITPNNENVFYEVGYAHALQKPTILLAERGKQLPFDVSPFRVLFYDNTISGKAKLELGLRKNLQAILVNRNF